MSEYHLFIVWHNGNAILNRVLEDIRSNFSVLKVIEIDWNPEDFTMCLRRFYGKNLPAGSKKEEEVGIGPFTVIVVRDDNPLYVPRRTNQNVKSVNINMFDSKEVYRHWAKSNVVHATNSTDEFRHDFYMLFGTNPSFETILGMPERYHNSIAGSHGWNSLEDLLNALNNTVRYVILRNFENYPREVQYGVHSDIDILCDNYALATQILNGVRTNSGKGRVQNRVNVGQDYILCDIRYVGDNYYDNKWEADILSNRIFNSNGFFTPCDTDLLYTLLYHVIVQKRIISEDYCERIKKLSSRILNEPIDIMDEGKSIEQLNEYLRKNNYHYIEPKDSSVGYNFKKIGKPASLRRELHEIKHIIALQIKGL